ncbi:S-adenosyl-L-methionine-dependent methyltransferase [Aspergillus floccosus]
MEANITKTGYILGRNISESVRLDAQHLLLTYHCGYVLHPHICVSESMNIAEVGTGTGRWLLDVARAVPETVQLDGFDVSDSQFPPRRMWPPNVTMSALNSLQDPPLHLRGKYNVVHLRMWTCIIQQNDPTPLIRHAKSLLKPGGYIQWEDADLGNHIICGERAENFSKMMRRLYDAARIQHSWLAELPKHLMREGLAVVEFQERNFAAPLVPLCINTYIMAHFDIIQARKDLLKESLQPYNIKHGSAYYWKPLTLLAQKSMEGTSCDEPGNKTAGI